MIRFMTLFALALYCLSFFSAHSEETRLALVIDQGEYAGENMTALRGTDREAQQIRSALEKLDFDVVQYSDLDKPMLRQRISEFRGRLEDAGPEAVGFFYYTGHGAQDRRGEDSFMLGIDSNILSSSDIASYGVSMKSEVEAFSALEAKAMFVVFDACRDMPVISRPNGTKSVHRGGLSRIEADRNMVIAYSTDAGFQATEGIYAPVLARQLLVKNRSAEYAFIEAQKEVFERTKETNDPQHPFTSQRMRTNVFLAGGQSPTSSGSSGTIGSSKSSSGVSLQTAKSLQARNQNRAAANMYRELCANDNADACLRLGVYAHEGRFIPQDLGEAIQSYGKACIEGSGKGCLKTGYMYEEMFPNPDGKLTNANFNFQAACHKEIVDGCVQYALRMKRRRAHTDRQQDYLHQRMYRQAACQLGHGSSCNSAAIRFLETTWQDEEDYGEANEGFRRGCDLQHGLSCYNLGLHTAYGRGRAVNASLAASYFKKACAFGYDEGCKKTTQ